MRKKRHASFGSKMLSVRLFGPPPLLSEENAAGYDELFTRVSSAVNPSDVIEAIWLRDVVELTWEISRWRRLKKEFLAEQWPTGNSILSMNSLKKIETVDRLTAIAETRRNAVLREIDHRRTAFAERVRNRIQHVEDAEFKLIEPRPITSNIAAQNDAA